MSPVGSCLPVKVVCKEMELACKLLKNMESQKFWIMIVMKKGKYLQYSLAPK